MRVLIVEDDEVLADGLMRYLQQTGYLVRTAASGTEADTILACEEFDLVILDLGLPGIDGFEVLRRVRRKQRYTPVIILSARDMLEDRVRGLDDGADDYLVKPFAPEELEARVRAIVRRGQVAEGGKITFGSLVVDMSARRAWLRDEPLRLTAREWLILEYLLSRSGKIVSKEQIAAAVTDNDGDTSHSALEVHISRLRSKLRPARVNIHSIRGFGYYIEEDARAG